MTDSSDSESASTSSSARRTTAIAVALLALAALCLWSASRLTWVRVVSSDGLGEARATSIVGSTWAAATTPLALALLAAIAASFALRGWASRILGILVLLAGIGSITPAVHLMISGASSERAGQLADLPARAVVTDTAVFALPAALTVLGALLAIGASLLMVFKPRPRQALSSKYASPAIRREEATRRANTAPGSDEGEDLTERMLWDALDAGDDPTEESGTRQTPG